MITTYTAPRRHFRAACATVVSILLGVGWPLDASPQLNLGRLIVSVTSPQSGSTVSGTITVEAGVSIVGALTVRDVQFKVDGVNLGAADTTAPYAVRWETTAVANGAHTVTAVARDLLGLQYASDPVTVTVFNDTTPPTVALTSPAPGSTIKGTISLTASASDNVAVAGVRFFDGAAAIGLEDTMAPYEVGWDTTTVAEGTHTLTAVARDRSGNTGTSAPVTVTVDRTPPTVTITSPTDGATVSGTIAVTATVSDNLGVAVLELFVDGALRGEDPTAPYEIVWDTTTVPDGSHVLGVRAHDGAGNVSGVATVTVTIANNDTTPPTVALTSPASGSTIKGTISLTASAFDNIAVAGVRFFDGPAAIGLEDTMAPYEVAWDTTTAAEGTHTLTAVARDSSGNTATSAPVTITVANAPPPETFVLTVTKTGIGTGTIASSPAGITCGSDCTESYSAGTVVTLSGTPDPGSVFEGWSGSGCSEGSSPCTVTMDRDRVIDGHFAVAPQPATTRFEETEAALAPAGSWSEISSAGMGVTLSGDRAVFTSEPGARATFTFTGTGVSWLGVRCEVCGIARVLVDGTLAGTVDTFADTRSADVLFTQTGLAAGSHTLVIEVTGTTGRPQSGAFIVVDAVDVPSDGAPPVSDRTAPAVSITAPAAGAPVSGTVAVEASASDDVGVAGVRFFVDEVPIGVEDTSAPYSVAWDTRNVGDGSHALTAIARDPSGNTAASLPVSVTVDNGSPATTRFEETAATLTPREDWFDVPETHPSLQGADLSGDQAVASGGAGARATFTFSGTRVSWIGLPCPECGIANVYVDGVQVATLDTFAPDWPAASSAIFTSSGLASGSHTLVIEATFMRNPSSTSAFVFVDAIDVTP